MSHYINICIHIFLELYDVCTKKKPRHSKNNQEEQKGSKGYINVFCLGKVYHKFLKNSKLPQGESLDKRYILKRIKQENISSN